VLVTGEKKKEEEMEARQQKLQNPEVRLRGRLSNLAYGQQRLPCNTAWILESTAGRRERQNKASISFYP
jgi:hypothetical protein